MCGCKEKESDLSLISDILDEYAKVPGSLITILQKAQEVYGYLPVDVIYHIAEALQHCLDLRRNPMRLRPLG